MLDAAWQLEPGRGSLTLAAMLDPRAVSAAASYRHRISTSWAAGAELAGVYDWRTRTPDWRALLTLGGRF